MRQNASPGNTFLSLQTTPSQIHTHTCTDGEGEGERASNAVIEREEGRGKDSKRGEIRPEITDRRRRGEEEKEEEGEHERCKDMHHLQTKMENGSTAENLSDCLPI